MTHFRLEFFPQFSSTELDTGSVRTEFAKKVYEDCSLLFKGGLCAPKGPLLLCSQLVNQATQFVGRRFGGHWKQEDWPLMILLKPYHFWACHWSAWASVAKTCALPSLFAAGRRGVVGKQVSKAP